VLTPAGLGPLFNLLVLFPRFSGRTRGDELDRGDHGGRGVSLQRPQDVGDPVNPVVELYAVSDTRDLVHLERALLPAVPFGVRSWGLDKRHLGRHRSSLSAAVIVSILTLSGHGQQDRVNVGGGRGSATLSPGAVAGSMLERPRMILVSSNEKSGYLAPGRASPVLVGLNHRPASG